MRTPKFATCVDNSHYPTSFERHKVYRVIPDEDAEKDGDLCVINESGEDYLFPSDYFVVVDLPLDVAAALSKSFPRGIQQAD